MTQDQKVKYFSIAMNVCRFGFTQKQADLLVRLYDIVCEKKGNGSLEDIARAQAENEDIYPSVNEML